METMEHATFCYDTVEVENGHKRNNADTFDVSMGSLDGAEICELVGLFILDTVGAKSMSPVQFF